jgi:hypothetical protein
MASRVVTVFFKGINGLGGFSLPISPGQFGARILTVQKLAEDISAAPNWVLQDVTAGVFFGPGVGPTGNVGQTTGNDFSDTLFAANIELL